MQRIAAILVLFVLLMNGRHVDRRLSAPVTPVMIEALAIPLDNDDPRRVRLGDMMYLGGWQLRGSHPVFGGLSSMRFNRDGTLDALSDNGERFLFRPGRAGQWPGRIMPLPIFAAERNNPKWMWDSESRATDPVSGRTWVGLELNNRICRYSRDFGRVEACAAPAALRRWPTTTAIESLMRMPDGRFLAIAESAPGPRGGTDVLLFSGDPADRRTPAPRRLSYVPPDGTSPTDAIWIGPGRMLVVNRAVSLAEGFTARLTLVDIGDLRPGAILKGRVVATLAGSIQRDNYEALALTMERGRPVLWIASDDNHLFFERTLLLKFAIPPAWTAPSPHGARKGR